MRHRSVLWRDMLEELKNGRLDVVCTTATVSADSAERVAFSAPYLDTQLAIVAHPDAPIHSID